MQDMSVTAMSVDTEVDNVDSGTHALSAFWAQHRLMHLQEQLREYLGTETLADLDDVHPGDLTVIGRTGSSPSLHKQTTGRRIQRRRRMR